MTWDFYKTLTPEKSDMWETRVQVNVECPNCGKKIWKRNDRGIVITTYPPRYEYEYECDCGWTGTAEI